MATELMAAGGCYNSMRYALDGAGQGARNWRAAHNQAAQMTQLMRLILAVNVDGDDMNDADDASFKIQWANVSDAPTTWYDLSSSGEIRYASDTDLIDGNAVVEAEDSGGNVVNCTGKGWSRADGIEVEDKNGITRTVVQDTFQDLHWAITLANADYENGDEYSFRLCQADDTVIGTMVANLTIVKAGKIDGITKNKDRTSPVVSVTVTAWPSDEAGSNPKPTSEGFVAQGVSDGATGAFSLVGNIISGDKYFLHFYKDDTADLSDGSPEVTAVDYA